MKRTKPKFRVGQRVRIKGYRRYVKIECFINDGTGVRIDMPVDGFTLWHLDDVVRIGPRPKRGGKKR